MKLSKKKGESGTIQYRTVERARVLGEKDIVGTPVHVHRVRNSSCSET